MFNSIVLNPIKVVDVVVVVVFAVDPRNLPLKFGQNRVINR